MQIALKLPGYIYNGAGHLKMLLSISGLMFIRFGWGLGAYQREVNVANLTFIMLIANSCSQMLKLPMSLLLGSHMHVPLGIFHCLDKMCTYLSQAVPRLTVPSARVWGWLASLDLFNSTCVVSNPSWVFFH